MESLFFAWISRKEHRYRLPACISGILLPFKMKRLFEGLSKYVHRTIFKQGFARLANTKMSTSGVSPYRDQPKGIQRARQRDWQTIENGIDIFLIFNKVNTKFVSPNIAVTYFISDHSSFQE